MKKAKPDQHPAQPAGRPLSEFEHTHNPSDEVRHLRAQLAQLEAKLEEQRRKTGEERLITMALTEAIVAAPPVKLQYRAAAGRGRPVTHVAHLTDLHYGETVEARDTEGFNAYSPAVAERRIQQLGGKLLDKTRVMRQGYAVPRLHILGTADYISGDIHRELSVTNEFPCPVQAVRCGGLLAELVLMLAPHFEQVAVDLLTLDNHGRMTPRPQAAEGGLNNWSYVVAEIVKQRVSRQPNVRVAVHTGPSALVAVGAEKYLLFHGHQIKGWAGLPYYGFDRRVALEAVKRMNLPEKTFTTLVCGHFHVSVDSPYWMIGGSLSGTNAFDHGQGRHMQAHQTSWFVHPQYGRFDFTRWFLS